MTQTHGGHGQGRSARAEGPHTPVTACTPSAATTGKQQQSATAQDARTICTGTPTVGRITDTLSKQMATQYPWLYERKGPFTWRARPEVVNSPDRQEEAS